MNRYPFSPVLCETVHYVAGLYMLRQPERSEDMKKIQRYHRRQKVKTGGRIILLLLAAAMSGYILIRGISLAASDNNTTRIFADLDYRMNQSAIALFMPGLNYPLEAEEEQKSFGETIVEKALSVIPIGGYVQAAEEYETEVESMSTYELILAGEANDENEVDEDGNLIVKDEEVDRMEEENAVAAQADSAAVADDDAAVAEISLDKLKDYDYLVSNFYSIDKTTTIDSSQLNAEKMLEKDMTMQGDNDQPQILIYHTHSQEAFADSKEGDESTTIVGAGAYLTELLEGYGYNVIHHTGVYDMQGGKLDRNQAYTLAGKAVQDILDENPSIEVVIDLHRDGVAESTHLVTEVNGKQTAQFMFFNGLSRTTTNGDISYLANQYIDDNLAFSFQMQMKATQYYPGVARKIYLKGYRYNMHLCPKTLLIECGAQTNTVEEIMNAMEPIADTLHMVLEGE